MRGAVNTGTTTFSGFSEYSSCTFALSLSLSRCLLHELATKIRRRRVRCAAECVRAVGSSVLRCCAVTPGSRVPAKDDPLSLPVSGSLESVRGEFARVIRAQFCARIARDAAFAGKEYSPPSCTTDAGSRRREKREAAKSVQGGSRSPHPRASMRFSSLVVAPAATRRQTRGVGVHWRDGKPPRCYRTPASERTARPRLIDLTIGRD